MKQKNLSIPCDYCDEILKGTKRVKSHYQNWHPNQGNLVRGIDNKTVKGQLILKCPFGVFKAPKMFFPGFLP